jgi:hypothetical protein
MHGRPALAGEALNPFLVTGDFGFIVVVEQHLLPVRTDDQKEPLLGIATQLLGNISPKSFRRRGPGLPAAGEIDLSGGPEA